MAAANLTKRQQSVLNTIKTYIDEHGYSPTVRELCELLNLKSTSTARGHLERLERDGYTTRIDGGPRTIKLLDKFRNVGESFMKEINCRELYRVPMNVSTIKEFYKLGQSFGIRKSIMNWINDNENLSDELKLSWMVQYYKEWNKNNFDLFACIREKVNLKKEKHLITYEFDSEEIVVLDILKTEYDKICKENDYLVKVLY